MNKVRKILVLLLTSIFLSSCGGRTRPTSQSSLTSSSNSSITTGSITSSTSGEKPVEKVKLEHNIKEYINNNYYPFSSSPYKGETNMLIIPVWFTDSDNFIQLIKQDNVLADIKDVFNKANTDLGWYSVSSFYYQESLGKLKLNGVVSDWYECGKSYTQYSTSSSSVTSLIDLATDWYFSSTGKSRKEFDADADGYLDSVILIYGCPDYVSLGDESKSNLWAYTSWLCDTSQKSLTNPGPNVFMWSSYDFMYSQSKALERTGFTYGYGDTRFTSLDSHTYIHEFGHVLGIEDYYDYSNYGYTPGGGFSMQDENVGGHDPYSTLLWEWSEVYMPQKSTTITIRDFQSSHDLILLANHDVTSVFDEYLLLELYTPNLLNELDSKYNYGGRRELGPSVPGIRVWHVDSRLLYITNPSSVSSANITTDPTTNLGKYGVYMMESNSYSSYNGSILGDKYYDYNILQLIRNDLTATYKPKDIITNNSLFRQGHKYDMTTYCKQFVKNTRFNDGSFFNWSFEITSIKSSEATIKLTLR